jgi:hypothetical protein
MEPYVIVLVLILIWYLYQSKETVKTRDQEIRDARASLKATKAKLAECGGEARVLGAKGLALERNLETSRAKLAEKGAEVQALSIKKVALDGSLARTKASLSQESQALS